MVFFHNAADLSRLRDYPSPYYWLEPGVDQTAIIATLLQRAASPPTTVYLEAGIQTDTLAPSTRTLPQAAAPPPPARRIACFAASDTLALSLAPVIGQLQQGGHRLAVFHRTKPYERADLGFERVGVASQPFSFGQLVRFRPELVLLGADWAADAKLIIAMGRRLGWRTACIQESIIDLQDTHYRRMRWADYVFVQGAMAAHQMGRPLQFITGNPRYEDLSFRAPTAQPRHLLINCNFTYNLYEEVRQAWLTDITSLLEEQGLTYTIAQHPRDQADLSHFKGVVKTNAGNIHGVMERADAIISRFSSVIHEGMLQGKPVIYYNPHGEKVGYDYAPDQQGLHYVEGREALRESIAAIRQADVSQLRQGLTTYLRSNLHVGVGQHPSVLIAQVLAQLAGQWHDGRSIDIIPTFAGVLKPWLNIPFRR